MMEATDLAKRHDAARLGPFDGPHVWRVLVERDNDMVEAIAPHRADEPFHEGILAKDCGVS